MILPKKVLIAVSGVSASIPEYPEGELAGLFISEALHPYNVFTAAGFDVDFASESGTYTADYLSLTENFLNGKDKEDYENKESDFRKKLDRLKKASEVNPEDYGIFFAAGGHTAVIDFPSATSLLKVAGDIYSKGGVVSAVCHGPIILGFINNPDTGKSILDGGVKATGFTIKGEEELKAVEVIKETWKALFVQEAVEQAGGVYVHPPGNWDVFTVSDKRVVSGVNPQSAEKTAEETIAVFAQ